MLRNRMAVTYSQLRIHYSRHEMSERMRSGHTASFWTALAPLLTAETIITVRESFEDL